MTDQSQIVKPGHINLDKTGIWLIDKPSGPTSHDVVNIVRKKSGHRRVGHTGTLDPLASGLLIILVGRSYTKLQSQFLKQDKEYEVTGQLGMTTDSYDIQGQVVSSLSQEDIHDSVSEMKLNTILPEFRGEIEQTVPAFSAVKVHGKKLYELARKQRKNATTTPVLEELPTRRVKIHQLDLLSYSPQPPASFQLRVACSSGTYIRSLVHDIGQRLMTSRGQAIGATVTQLRRTKIGDISVDRATHLSQI